MKGNTIVRMGETYGSNKCCASSPVPTCAELKANNKEILINNKKNLKLFSKLFSTVCDPFLNTTSFDEIVDHFSDDSIPKSNHSFESFLRRGKK